ncbi:MAG: AAA domain-containing protein [Candidatus Wallbacteria bacterium]
MSLITQIETAAKIENEVKITSNSGTFTGKIYDFTPKTVVLKELSGAYKNIDINAISAIQDLSESAEPPREEVKFRRIENGGNYFTDLNSLASDINREISEIKTRKMRKTIVVERYELKKQHGDNYYYEIYVSEDFKIQEEMNIRLYAKIHELVAVVISTVHDLKLTIQTNEKLIGELYRIDISFDPGFILRAMSNSFDIIKNRPAGLYGKLLDKNLDDIKLINNDSGFNFAGRLNEIQKEAVKLACRSEISFIWGPPGTGKTHTLAELLYQKLNNGQKCLVVSTSNAAIDQVIKSFHKLLPDHETLPAVRLGHTDDETCLAYIKSGGGFTDVPIVFSTLATCSLRYADLSEYSFDTVIIDEASMVSTAHAVMAASLADESVVFAGDENQLPPISLSASKSLSMNIYDYIPAYKNSKFVKMLNVQYRMNEKISDFISETFYDGILKCGTGINPLRPVFINIDNSRYNSAYYSVDEESYYNPMGLFISDAIIKSLKPEELGEKILLISPFRAQQIIYSKYIIDRELTGASSLTIHKSQGSEAETVIVDITAYDAGQAFYNSNAIFNLLNVAFSRAKKRLFIIGSLEMIKKLSLKDSFWAAINYQLQNKFEFKEYRVFLDKMEALTFDLFEKHNGKSFLITDDGNNSDFFEYIAGSAADKKYYISSNYCDNEILLKNRVILRTKSSNKLPLMVIYDDFVIAYFDGRYKILKLANAAGSIKRIATAHLVDIEDDNARHTHSLLCSKCESNMIIEGSFSYFHLKCPKCGLQNKISEKIANDIKRIYEIKCPECLSEVQPMKKASDHTYTFFGCMNYPRCRGAVPFSSLKG